jgi:hypothetical protein
MGMGLGKARFDYYYSVRWIEPCCGDFNTAVEIVFI